MLRTVFSMTTSSADTAVNDRAADGKAVTGKAATKAATEAVTKAVLFHELGGPEVLKVEEVPLPEPGAGEVLFRVEAIGLNRAEALFRAGTY